MEKTSDIVDENAIPEITSKDVIKEGYLKKQSRFLKEWRS